MSFSIADGRIYIRNYQIVEDNATLAEMGKLNLEIVVMLSEHIFLHF